MLSKLYKSLIKDYIRKKNKKVIKSNKRLCADFNY